LQAVACPDRAAPPCPAHATVEDRAGGTDLLAAVRQPDGPVSERLWSPLDQPDHPCPPQAPALLQTSMTSFGDEEAFSWPSLPGSPPRQRSWRQPANRVWSSPGRCAWAEPLTPSGCWPLASLTPSLSESWSVVGGSVWDLEVSHRACGDRLGRFESHQYSGGPLNPGHGIGNRRPHDQVTASG